MLERLLFSPKEILKTCVFSAKFRNKSSSKNTVVLEKLHLLATISDCPLGYNFGKQIPYFPIGHRFWRIVNEAHLPRSWVINQVKFFADKHARKPLDTPDPRKAFASSSYLGYEPGSAFDNKSSTYWLPNGWYDRGPGEDFIGYEFPQPVAINSVRVTHQSGQGNVVSKKMYVEAADAYTGPYVTKWIIENTKSKSSKRFNNKSKSFLKRFLSITKK